MEILLSGKIRRMRLKMSVLPVRPGDASTIGCPMLWQLGRSWADKAGAAASMKFSSLPDRGGKPYGKPRDRHRSAVATTPAHNTRNRLDAPLGAHGAVLAARVRGGAVI